MKNVLTTIIIVFGAFTATFAQQQKGNVEFGINTGFSVSSLSYGLEDFNTFRKSIHFGLSSNYYFSDRWSILGKLIYDPKGSNGLFLINQDFSNSFSDPRLNYLTVPITANWHFGKKRNWYLNVGPYAGFLVSAKERGSDIDIKHVFKSTDFGVSLGIGVKLPLSEAVKAMIEYDLQFGAINAFKNNSGISAHNERASLDLGLCFMLK
jgi:opacity protein-like surface antigen